VKVRSWSDVKMHVPSGDLLSTSTCNKTSIYNKKLTAGLPESDLRVAFSGPSRLEA
jgi:hypothetical protein